MSVKNVDRELAMRRAAFSSDRCFRGLARYIFACIVLLIALCDLTRVVAETKVESGVDGLNKDAEPVLGDPNYKHDLKYSPIYANMDGSSFALHYCLPGFVPQGLGDCDRGSIPGRDPRGVQVVYTYYLHGRDAEQARLEGSAAYAFPFQINVDIDGKTPYLAQYIKSKGMSKSKYNQVVKAEMSRQGKFEGLDFYELPGHSGGWWVPKNLAEFQTKLGNPPIFVCGQSSCFINLDQGNGWMVSARFNELALKNWRDFFVQLNGSIKIIMEK